MDNLGIKIIEGVGEKSSHIFFVYDLQGDSIVYLSPAFEKISGRKKTEVKSSEDILSLIAEEDRRYVTYYIKRIKEVPFEKVEFRIVHSNGKVKFLRSSAYLLGEGNNLFVGYAEDITSEKQSSDSLVNINARKNVTLEILSHDLTSPIGLIQSMSSRIEKELRKENLTHVIQYTKLTREICERSIDLIADIVNQEFLESGNVNLNIDRVDLIPRIHNILDVFKLGEDEIAKKFLFETSLKQLYVEVDEVKFLQVITNLISNSIKFTHDNGVILIRLEEHDKSFLLVIEDNGVGIPKEMQPVLFEKFTPARRPGLKGEKSIGLGMSIIKRIVELHQGRIWFESEENKGSKFFVEVPKLSV